MIVILGQNPIYTYENVLILISRDPGKCGSIGSLKYTGYYLSGLHSHYNNFYWGTWVYIISFGKRVQL